MKRALPLLLLASAALADPSGHKWFSAQTPFPIQYRVFAHSEINGLAGFSSNVLPAVQSGFSRWTNAQNACTSWNVAYGGAFTSPSGLAAIGNDGQNRMIWLGGSQWLHGSSTLGLTTTTYFTSNGQITDGDLEMNNDHAWKLGGTGNALDVESITTHEAGHFLGLNHSAATAAVMYAHYPYGSIKRTLTQGDVTDVCTVYPASTAVGAQGDPCTQDSQCGSGLACRGAVGASSKICTKTCSSSGTSCPTGYTCQSASPSGMACLPPVGSVDLCRFCTSGSQCSTGMCVTDGQRNWCTRTCAVDADCGGGYSCVDGTTSKICAPKNNSCPTAQCSSNGQCAVGYACTGGMCTATGNPGDRCEVSLYCDSCSVCVGTLQEAYCRPCCGGATGDGACNGCGNTSCAQGEACFGLTNSSDQVCAPSEGVSLCQACDSQTPCQAGLTCLNNRCHADCNPTSPGACQACYPTGASGLCACPDEIAQTGQPCGQTSSGLRVCVTGNACVGSPAACRARCTLGDDSSCPSGQVCRGIDGEAVCVQGTTPGQRCSACENGTGCGPGLTCWSGRCYEGCTTGASSCSSCVLIEGSVGVCACDDQLGGAGQFCGLLTSGGTYEVYACATGTACVANTCQVTCVPGVTVCPLGQACTDVGGVSVCGGPAATPPDRGTVPGPDDGGGGTVTSGGCGCTSGGSAGFLWALLSLAGVGATRRPRNRG